MDSKPKRTAKERHCWYCGEPMGLLDERYYRSGDTCGKSECERSARDAERQERDEAHAALDADRGWDRGNF